MNGKLQSMFLRDGKDMIETLDYVLSQLQVRGYQQELIDQAFRSVHSLKSEASYLGYRELADRASVVEAAFETWRKQKKALPETETEKVLVLIQKVKQIFSSIGASAAREVARGDEAPSSRLTLEPNETLSENDRLNAPHPITSIDKDPEFAIRVTSFQRQLLREAQSRSELLYSLECDISPSEPMTYARLYLVINNLEQLVHVVKLHPDIEVIRTGGSSFLQVLLTTAVSEEQIRKAVNVDQIERVRLETLNYDRLVRDNGPAEADDATNGRRSFSVTMPARLYEELCLNADEIYSKLRQESVELEKAPIESSIRARIQWNLFLINRLAGWMRNEISSFSTVALAEVFQELPRLVESLAQQLGKRVNLKVWGDRERVYLPVSGILTDVLIHLIRNAIDHGIELPEARRKLGKPETGTLRISAFNTRDHLTIRVEDDGGGISEELVQAVERGAIQKQMSTTADRDPLSEQQNLLSVISRAGFTTRSKPGEISGHGVGLDVVSYSVRKLLCGSIELQNRPGKGCIFSLILPASTNFITVLVLHANDEYLALPRVFIVDTFALDRRFVFTDENDATYYRYSGENIRMYAVYEHFPEALSFNRDRMGVVVEVAGERGLIVADDFVAEETVVHDRSRRNAVFSQILNKDIRLFLPSQLLSALSFRRGEQR